MNQPATNVNVDGLSPNHSVTIKVGGAILWSSASGRSFTISAMVPQGNGPAHPFEKHFPNPDPPSTQVHSGRALPAAAKCNYKYTVAFDHGPTIDPTVIIDQ